MLAVRGVVVRFGDVVALDGVDLDVGEGETVALLGPSGCGKSTLLRVVAGLQVPERGSVALDGVDLGATPPHRRSMGLMFQDHALFGHRDVAANVGFGPRMQHMTGRDVAVRVDEVLRLVGLAGFGDRDVATLSGGEAQRVALARALAARPRLLMLDEPLGSLDRRLRDRLVDEIRDVLDGVGVSSIHVTHDHDEAFTIADRVAVMQGGGVVRVGCPVDVWRDPRTEFVARFLGHPNIVSVQARGVVPWGRLDVEVGTVVIRLDALRPVPAGQDADMRGTVTSRRFRDDHFEIAVRTEPGDVDLIVTSADEVPVGAAVAYSIDVARVARLL